MTDEQSPELRGTKPEQQDRTWLEDPKNISTVTYALYGICALLVIIDPFVHKHGPFMIEHAWGFYAICGLFASIGLMFAAKLLRALLTKPEDYYDR